MIGRVNSLRKVVFTTFVVLGVIVFVIPADAQLFKRKKSKSEEKEPAAYAYQTFSTTKRKEKRRGYAGDEARFQFEKPLEPVPYGKIDREVDYSKAPYFGHKRPPVRRPPGSMKLCKVCGIKH